MRTESRPTSAPSGRLSRNSSVVPGASQRLASNSVVTDSVSWAATKAGGVTTQSMGGQTKRIDLPRMAGVRDLMSQPPRGADWSPGELDWLTGLPIAAAQES